ncbi:gluconate transporter [Corynebacterium yudongzhengii]|uniref:GntP family permease n=1 Tax=Corynebacterium yudongzhengii TaxID=2080740 RepID=A0A2U1T8E1_9CORY|nr:GntP family permease [Corynebacterium yudongzhengii]AWB81874.1 gluconate transporter [Corynebacterium yudongzhengii]PWC02266.1 GntP family permease [Corynebacterium yudongzhengii]
MTGIPLITTFAVAIVLMIVMISKWRIHPFISIMLVSFGLGLIGGIPLVDKEDEAGETVSGIATVIGEGFSGTFTSIGIVIILGALIGLILEKTGAAFQIADALVRVIGRKRPVLAMQLMGWVVSIPVFCDSGFVILNPIRRALARRTASSSVAMTVALAAGLYIAQVFIPPTPGPIAAANTLGISDKLLLVIGLGTIVSVPALIVSYIYAVWIGKRVRSTEDEDGLNDAELEGLYEELRSSYGRLPSATVSFLPILVPILAMAAGSVGSVLGWPGLLGDVVGFFGTPIIALALGLILAVAVLGSLGRIKEFYTITEETLKVVGRILFITAAGGVLGKVIANTDLVDFVQDNATVFASLGLFFPFIVSAILKTAQGSSTVALVTAAGIVAPLLPALGLESPTQVALAVMAISARAMTVSHANNSYFWVVANFGGMTPQQGYRTQTTVTLLMGLTSIIIIWILGILLI